MDDTKDKLIWKWIKGASTVQDDFGDPTAATDISLCIYTGSADTLSLEADVAADAMTWKLLGEKGYKYKDLSGLQAGVQKVVLKGGEVGKAKALVKGKGTNLPNPALGSLPLPVTVQLLNSTTNVCFQSTFDAGDVIKNELEQFKAKVQ